MPIGVFDSGLGGLTVLAALRRALPAQDFIYFGDNRNAPYGTRPAGEILDLTIAGTEVLFARGCRLVILACNTASAAALRQMQEFWVPADRRVLGVLVPMIEVLAGRVFADRGPPGAGPARDVAFFATPATVASGAFERELALRITGTRVVSQACTGLVDALEAGDMGAARAGVAGAVAAVLAQSPAPDAAILGCTHYPLVRDAFAAALPRRAAILSQPECVAASLCDYLARHPRFARGTGRLALLTSGDPARVSAGAARLTGCAYPFGSV